MATKQETAVKSAVTREKKKGIVREEKHILWGLLAIIVILLYLLLAQHSGWWPFLQPKLGSAFYTNVSLNAPTEPTAKDSSSVTGGKSSDDSSDHGSSNDSGSNANSGGGNGDSSGGGSTSAPTGSDSIGSLAANINIGDSKTEINGQANDLGMGCAVVVNASSPNVGKQEVCTYSQGDKIVTVTYLNDRVISASKSGF